MAHTRKCPQCGTPVVGTRSVCPRCQGGMQESHRWDDPQERRSAREEKLHAANVRMRNSGIGLFIMGVLLLSQGVDGAANRLTPVGAMGVLFIVVGTICFLWGWKLNQLEK